jgi:hypothetical protein
MKYELEYTSDFEKDKERLRKSGEIQALQKLATFRKMKNQNIFLKSLESPIKNYIFAKIKFIGYVNSKSDI